MFWICTLNDFFLIIYHLDWHSHSLCLVLSLADSSDMCKRRDWCSQALGVKAIEVQSGRVETWKGYPVGSGVLGQRVELCMSPLECMHFHVSQSLRRESITSTMGLQMAVPATQGCWHRRNTRGRQPCSEGGLGRVTGQGRTSGGCMDCSLDHT